MGKKTIAEMMHEVNDEYQYTIKREGGAVGVSSQGFLYGEVNEDTIFMDDKNKMYAVFDGVGGRQGGSEMADLSKELLSLNAKSELGMQSLFISVAVGVYLMNRIVAKNEKEEISYEKAQKLFVNEYQKKYEDHFGIMPRQEVKFVSEKYYEKMLRKGAAIIRSGSTVATGVRWYPEKKELDIAIVGDTIAYLVQDGKIVFESTFRGINTCSGFITGTYEDYKIYAKKLDEAFPHASQQRKFNELSYNKITGAISADLDFFVCNELTIPYDGENNYLVLVSDGYSDSVAPCDVAYISKQSENEQEMLCRLEHMLAMKYISMIFSYYREEKYKNKLYYNAIESIIRNNTLLQEMYQTFSDVYKNNDGHNIIPEWIYSHYSEEKCKAIIPLLKTLDNSPMVYDEYKYHKECLLENGGLGYAHSAFAHFRQSILMAKRKNGPERYMENMIPSLSRMIGNYGKTITKFVKCDNYSIVVKKLS